MTYEEIKIYCEEQRKLSVQLGIPIFTVVQPKREVVMEMVNFKESYDFLDKMHFDGCYKPFRDIIQEVMIKPYVTGLAPRLYVNDEDIGISEDFVCFVIRDYLGKYDDQIVGTYKFPIEAFVTADELRKYIAEYKIAFKIVVDDYCKRKP